MSAENFLDYIKRPARHPSSPLSLRCRKTCPVGREELEDCRTPLRCVRQTSSLFRLASVIKVIANGQDISYILDFSRILAN